MSWIVPIQTEEMDPESSRGLVTHYIQSETIRRHLPAGRAYTMTTISEHALKYATKRVAEDAQALCIYNRNSMKASSGIRWPAFNPLPVEEVTS